MTLHIYNTLTRIKQEFEPIKPGKVKMYVCGVTVYDHCHLGHGRAYVAFDVIYRYLKYIGYDVTYVRNITDIDDKIIARANEMDLPSADLKQRVSILTKKYIEEFHKDMEALNILPPAREPSAIEYIPQMIKIIEKLLKSGLAYVIGNDVYFEVGKSKGYGKLSCRSTDELLAGARVEPDTRKKASLDFCLWKEAKPNEPYWESPWGNGRPGWHIECSAMSLNILGEEFDIHGGGQDLIFPHHENEIAQSSGFTGKQPVRYWIHNGFVTINREKMSKSLGNFFTLKDIFKKYDPCVVRYFLLAQHYRSPVDFSDQLLEDAKHALNRIGECINRGGEYLEGSEYDLDKWGADNIIEEFRIAMDDDFNTAKALAVVFEVVKSINSDVGREDLKEKVYTQLTVLKEMLDVLGIKYTLPNVVHVDIGAELVLNESELDKILSGDADNLKIVDLIKARNYFRRAKQWKLADKIRKYLTDKGHVLQDSSGGIDCVNGKA